MPKIMFIDSDTSCRNHSCRYSDVTPLLPDDYKTLCIHCDDNLIAQTNKFKPHLILLDFETTNESQADLCAQLKKLDSTVPPTLAFLVKESSLEQRLECADLGADDSIDKSISAEELKFKIKELVRYHKEKELLSENAENARKVAFTSMTEASQYGYVLQFITKSYQCNDTYQLAQTFFNFMQQLNLICCVQIRDAHDTESMKANFTPCSPIDLEIFEISLNKDRIIEFHNRLVVTEQHLSVIVKNMPVGDPDQCGRIKDLIASATGGFEAKLIDLQQKEDLEQSIQDIKSIIHHVNTQFNQQGNQTTAVMDDLMIELSSALNVLGLTEEQETFFIQLVETQSEKLVNLIVGGEEIKNNLHKVMEKLSRHIK